VEVKTKHNQFAVI